MIERNLTDEILESLTESPVVLIHGARQTGKTTLARHIADNEHPAEYLTFDDATVLAAAKSDPEGFVEAYTDPVVIDEIQRIPEVLLAIKREVDNRRRPGRFLLTGSAHIFSLPALSESLAGRMEIHTLWPFSQGEMAGRKEGFIDAAFRDGIHENQVSGEDRSDILRRLISGGFPEIQKKRSDRRRGAWFESYITAIMQRDLREISNIEQLTQVPSLLSILANRTSSILNLADISKSSGIPYTTLRRYLALLEATFLVQRIPPWFVNVGKRLVKSPKVIIPDTGLVTFLIGINEKRLKDRDQFIRPLLETFVASELMKQITWSEVRPRLYHLRTQTGLEVDLVLEDRAGRLIGIEVKAASSVNSSDFKGLKTLAEFRPDKFVHGFVLYLGKGKVDFRRDLTALPVSALWTF